MGSLDHSIGPRQHVGRNRQAELLSGFEIDHQLKLCGLLDGQFGRLGTLENLVDVESKTLKRVRKIGTIGHQSPSVGKLTPPTNAGHPQFHRKLGDLFR